MSSEIILNDFQNSLYKGITGGSDPSKSVLLKLAAKLGVLDSNSEPSQEVDMGNVTEGSEKRSGSLQELEWVKKEAEVMARDVICTFGDENSKKPPNKYCRTLRRTVKELSSRHDLVFKGIVNKLNPDVDNARQTFVTVADELFGEGQANWGRVVAVYAFAAHLAVYLTRDIETSEISNKEQVCCGLKENIAQFVGQYVANKLGPWVVDRGGWDAFVEYFPDHVELEAKLWKYGLMTTLALGAVATVFATR